MMISSSPILQRTPVATAGSLVVNGGSLSLGLRRLRSAIAANAAQHPFFWGIALMMATTSLWALAFIAPLAIPDASAIEIALGRFIVYGLISAAAVSLRRILRLPLSILVQAVVFALAGNIVYYVLLVLGIQLAGATMAVLIIGMLPVTISLCGQLQSGPRKLPQLAAPLVLFGLGVILFNAGKTGFFRDTSAFSPAGILCMAASLGMWTWYAIANARFLKQTTVVTATEWSSIVGLMSLVLALIGLPLSWSSGLARDPLTLAFAEFRDVALWSILLGGGATWLGTVLFNMASKLLTTTIMGQLIIFEAIFGTAYVFAMTGRAPSLLEFVGIALALAAVWLSIRRLQSNGG